MVVPPLVPVEAVVPLAAVPLEVVPAVAYQFAVLALLEAEEVAQTLKRCPRIGC